MTTRPATPQQCKEICERQAKKMCARLFWIGENRAQVRKGQRVYGELFCERPYFPIASKGAAYGFEVGQLRDAITEEIWQSFPAERA
jgi:hypothetical protein